MIFSIHFRYSLKTIGAILIFLAGTYIWLKHKMHNIISPPRITLSSNDKELISYDENKHIISITTAKGTIQKYSRDSKVEIRKDGTVKVNTEAWGFELRPFLGAGYSDTARVYLGCYGLYFHQLDMGLSLGWTSDNRKSAFEPLLSLSYNVWSNTSIGVGVNPISLLPLQKPEIAVLLSVKL